MRGKGTQEVQSPRDNHPAGTLLITLTTLDVPSDKRWSVLIDLYIQYRSGTDLLLHPEVMKHHETKDWLLSYARKIGLPLEEQDQISHLQKSSITSPHTLTFTDDRSVGNFSGQPLSEELKALIAASPFEFDTKHPCLIDEQGTQKQNIDYLSTLKNSGQVITANPSAINLDFFSFVNLAVLSDAIFNVNSCIGGSAPICEALQRIRRSGKFSYIEAVIDTSIARKFEESSSGKWTSIYRAELDQLLRKRERELTAQISIMSFISFGTHLDVSKMSYS